MALSRSGGEIPASLRIALPQSGHPGADPGTFDTESAGHVRTLGTGDRRIRILRIATRLNTGGPAVYLATLCRGLPASRYEQWLAAGREGPGEGSMRPLVEAHAISPIAIPEMVGTSRLGPADIGALVRTRRLIRHLRPDIVETHMSKAGIVGRLAARLEGSPIVVHVYHGHVLAGILRRRENVARALRRADARAIVGSPRRGERPRQGRPGEVQRLPRPQESRWWSPASTWTGCCTVGTSAARFVKSSESTRTCRSWGSSAGWRRSRTIRCFCEAAAAIAAARPEARFLVVGDGDLRPEIEAGARRLNLMPRMIFTGWRYDLPRVYSDLDVLAMSSDNEGTPIALIEAMAAGCPVVATNVGGVPDIIDHGRTGLLVPVRDPHGLAAAILRLLRDEPLARELAASARRHVRVRFSVSRFVADMDSLYERLVADRALPRRAARPGLRNRTLEGRAIAPDAMGVEEGARG